MTEIGDWERFTGASIGAYLGLVPSEHSSGPSRVQGAITKTGNTPTRLITGRTGILPRTAILGRLRTRIYTARRQRTRPYRCGGSLPCPQTSMRTPRRSLILSDAGRHFRQMPGRGSCRSGGLSRSDVIRGCRGAG